MEAARGWEVRVPHLASPPLFLARGVNDYSVVERNLKVAKVHSKQETKTLVLLLLKPADMRHSPLIDVFMLHTYITTVVLPKSKTCTL